MHTLKPYPGKFEGNESQMLARAVYNASCNGSCESLGDVDGFGYFALVVGKLYSYILNENSQGFVDVGIYSHAEAKARWQKISDEYDKFESQAEESD